MTMPAPANIPIATFQDILDAMARDPQLGAAVQQHVLSQQFLQLPAIVHELARGQQQMQDAITDLTARTTQLEETVAGLAREMAALKETVAQLAREMAEGFRTLFARTERMEQNLNSLAGHLGNIRGTRYEQAVAAIAPRILRDAMSMVAATVAHKAWQPGDLITAAANSASITTRDAIDLARCDLVITGRSPDGQPRHALAEISLAIQETDVRRAHRRAHSLQDALGSHHPVAPLVFGDHTDSETRLTADRLGVRIIIIPEHHTDDAPTP